MLKPLYMTKESAPSCLLELTTCQWLNVKISTIMRNYSHQNYAVTLNVCLNNVFYFLVGFIFVIFTYRSKFVKIKPATINPQKVNLLVIFLP